eukprot:RCo026149
MGLSHGEDPHPQAGVQLWVGNRGEVLQVLAHHKGDGHAVGDHVAHHAGPVRNRHVHLAALQRALHERLGDLQRHLARPLLALRPHLSGAPQQHDRVHGHRTNCRAGLLRPGHHKVQQGSVVSVQIVPAELRGTVELPEVEQKVQRGDPALCPGVVTRRLHRTTPLRGHGQRHFSGLPGATGLSSADPPVCRRDRRKTSRGDARGFVSRGSDAARQFHGRAATDRSLRGRRRELPIGFTRSAGQPLQHRVRDVLLHLRENRDDLDEGLLDPVGVGLGLQVLHLLELQRGDGLGALRRDGLVGVQLPHLPVVLRKPPYPNTRGRQHQTHNR